jgi:hypothetical protein
MPLAPRVAAARPATPAEWDAAWRECPYATYFHSRAWAEAWSEGVSPLVPRAYALAFDDGFRAVLPAPYEERYGGVVRTHYLSPGGNFGGWLSSGALTGGHAQALADWAGRRLGSFTWRLSPYEPLVHSLSLPGSVKEDATHALDLRGGWDALARRWKAPLQGARKAERLGVTVRPAETEADWRAYHGIYGDALDRWGEGATSRYRWELFDALRRRPENVDLWLAWHEGRVVCGALCFRAARHYVYWHGANHGDAMHLEGPRAVLCAAARHVVEQGCDWFDFNPSGGLEGVVRFKELMGARALPSPVVVRERAWVRTARGVVGAARRAVR